MIPYRTGWTLDVRTLADERRTRPIDQTPHEHFHEHGGGPRHAHTHVHPDEHGHTNRSDEPAHARTR